jgi:hypothetical protein
MTVDNSFTHKTEVTNDGGKVDKKFRKFYRALNINTVRQPNKNNTMK